MPFLSYREKSICIETIQSIVEFDVVWRDAYALKDGYLVPRTIEIVIIQSNKQDIIFILQSFLCELSDNN